MTSEEYITLACLAVVGAGAASIVAPALAVLFTAVFAFMMVWPVVQGVGRLYLAVTGAPPSQRDKGRADRRSRGGDR
jgi:hypothetical protein